MNLLGAELENTRIVVTLKILIKKRTETGLLVAFVSIMCDILRSTLTTKLVNKWHAGAVDKFLSLCPYIVQCNKIND